MAGKIDRYVKRPVGYMYVDGIYEMFMGVVFVGFVLLDPVWLIVLTVIAHGCTYLLKRRITYPRTGYVKLQSQRKKAWIGGIAGAVAALVMVIFTRGAAHTFYLFLIPVLWASLYAYITRLAQLENLWWRWIVTMAMIAGPAGIALLSVDREAAGLLGMGLVGILYLGSGVVTFSLYMRQTHPPQVVAE